MKILFLDIDGVLNSDSYMESESYYAECASLGIVPEGSNVMLQAHHLHIDPAAIMLINDLVDKSQVTVVLSSTWRKKYSLAELNLMFKKRGATFEISAVTPAKMSWRPRGYDITAYLNELSLSGITPETFVILDDVDEFSKLQDHFIQTDEVTGVTKADIDQAFKILGVENA